MTDEPDVTSGGESPSLEDRVNILQDAVGLAHRNIGELRFTVKSHEAQVVLLAVGLVLLAGALLLLNREVSLDGPGS